MIYRVELYYNMVFTWVVSKFGLVHYDVDLNTKQYYRVTTSWRKVIFYMTHSFWIGRLAIGMYVVYKFDPFEAKMLHLMVVYPFPLAAIVINSVEYMLWKSKGTYTQVMNEFCQILNQGHRTMQTLTRVRLVELMLIFCPTIVLFTGAAVPIFGYAIDPELPQLLWAVMPSNYRSLGTFIMCIGLDAVAMSILITYVWSAVVIGSAVVLLFDDLLDSIQRKATAALGSKVTMLARSKLLEELAFEIRCACIRLQIFNDTGSYVIFILKQMCLAVSVLSLAIGIRTTDPALAAICICVGIPCLFFYNIIFDQAFAFPTKMRNILATYLIASRKFQFKSWRNYCRMMAASVLYKGIQVGSFQTLERNSTLNFIGFVVAEATSLLLGMENI